MTVSNSYISRPALEEPIRKTVANTFLTLGGLWVITALASYGTLGFQMGLGSMLMLFGGSIACIFAVHALRNSGFGLALLGLFAGLEGASLGPLMNHYLAMKGGTEMVATAAGLTALATFACAAYCVTSRRSFSRLGGFLFAGLIVLLAAMVVGLFFPTPAIQLAISTAACLLFTAYMLFDISRVVSGEEDNYITASLSIYLDMLNLFLHLLRILGIVNASDD